MYVKNQSGLHENKMKVLHVTAGFGGRQFLCNKLNFFFSIGTELKKKIKKIGELGAVLPV